MDSGSQSPSREPLQPLGTASDTVTTVGHSVGHGYNYVGHKITVTIQKSLVLLNGRTTHGHGHGHGHGTFILAAAAHPEEI